jgi:Fic family protein
VESEYVFSHDYSLVPPKKDIDISFNEINQIILQCPEKNQKLLVYSMLIHSKRFANKDGIFYMTFNQMEEVSGLTRMTCINQINKLEKLGAIEVV